VTFFVLPILYFIAKTTSRKLRTVFEKYMNIEPIDEDKLPLTTVPMNNSF
jgi:hypothetical protein